MDVKQIREEISKIDNLLTAVDADIQKNKLSEAPVPRETIEAEYMALLSALGSGTTNPAFPSLHSEDEPMGSSASALDAFTYFGLLQAFLDDPIVLACLSRIFSSVTGVTSTQLEDALVTAERISDPTSKRDILLAIIDRIISEIEQGKTGGPDFSIVALCCQRLGSEFHMPVLRLLQVPGWDQWPPFVQLEMAYYLQAHMDQSELIPRFIQCVVDAAVGSDGSVLERNLKLQTPRTAFQLLALLRLREVSIDRSIITSFVERSVKAQSLPSGQVRQVSDIHSLCKEFALWNSPPSSPAWTAIVEKLGSGTPAYEYPGTVAALERVRVYSDNLFSNILSVKKRIGAYTKGDLAELASYLVAVGDKSSGSAVTKFIIDRRDLFVPDNDTGLLATVVELAAISSVESGTIIPDAILLFKKNQASVYQWFQTNNALSTYLAVSQLLLPSVPISESQISETENRNLISDSHGERIRRCLEILGFSETGDGRLASGSVIDGIWLDFVFPQNKTCIIIERNSVYNVSSKRAVVSGLTAMKANIMAQRKSWKVIVVIPELYADDKSLIGLLADPLKKIPINAAFAFACMDDTGKLSPNQRIETFSSSTESLPELARVLYLVLRYSISMSRLDIDGLVCGDQCISLVILEFLATYIVKHKGDLSVNICKPSAMSADLVLKLVEALNYSGTASGGFGVINLKLGLANDVRAAVIGKWTELHASSTLKLIEGPNQTIHHDSNVVILS